MLRRHDLGVLAAVFQNLESFADEKGNLHCSIRDILGGDVTSSQLQDYRDKLSVVEVPIFGGWTTCIWIETSDGYDLVFDCGSGFRLCARRLQRKWNERPERDLYIFGTHSHLDHTEGFDQAAVCFDPRNHLHIYGNRQFLWALDSTLGIFSRQVLDNLRGVQTPISFQVMPASFEGIQIREASASSANLGQGWHPVGEPVELGKTRIIPFPVHHPAPCLAYRIEHGSKVFVFCTDHELRLGDNTDVRQVESRRAERRLIEHCRDVDLLYRDGQFLRDEYYGKKGIDGAAPVSRLDWGHSCIEDVIKMARDCGVKRTLIGHHDPNRGWQQCNEIDDWLHSESDDSCSFELARSETVIDL